MSQIKDGMTHFITEEEIKQLVKKVAREIESDYKDKEVILICPLKGSLHFTADLSRELHLPCHIDFVQLQTVEKGGAVKLIKDISVNITNKHVIIIEEIIDTGRVLLFLRNRLLSSNPASLKIACLLDKPARRELPIRADYIGKTIEDRYVVGYGMDQEELGRNYKNIYIMKN